MRYEISTSAITRISFTHGNVIYTADGSKLEAFFSKAARGNKAGMILMLMEWFKIGNIVAEALIDNNFSEEVD